MRRFSVCLALVAALFVALSPMGAEAAKKKKRKIFKPRTYDGRVVSTNPAAPSDTQVQLIVRKDSCRPVTGGAVKRGICLRSSISGEYLTSCTKNGRQLNGNGPSGLVVADYLMKSSGTGDITFRQEPVPPPPPASPDTIEITTTFRVTKTTITGTSMIHQVFKNPDGDMICDGSAEFSLTRTK